MVAVRCWEVELWFPEIYQYSIGLGEPRLPSSLEDERFLLFATRERLEKVAVFFAPCPRQTRYWSWKKHIECHKALDNCDYIKVFEIANESINDEELVGKEEPDTQDKDLSIGQGSGKLVDVSWFFNPTGSQTDRYLCLVASPVKGCERCTSASVDCLLHCQNHLDQKKTGQLACTTCIISRLDDCSFQMDSKKPCPLGFTIRPLVEVNSRTSREDRDYRSTIPDSQESEDSIISDKVEVLSCHPSVDVDLRSEGTKKPGRQSLQGSGSKSDPIILESDSETKEDLKFYE